MSDEKPIFRRPTGQTKPSAISFELEMRLQHLRAREEKAAKRQLVYNTMCLDDDEEEEYESSSAPDWF